MRTLTAVWRLHADIYQQSQGSGNWSDFMQLVEVLHSNLTGPPFVQALSDCFDVDKYVYIFRQRVKKRAERKQRSRKEEIEANVN